MAKRDEYKRHKLTTRLDRYGFRITICGLPLTRRGDCGQAFPADASEDCQRCWN